MWHNLDRLAMVVWDRLEPRGDQVVATYDMDCLTRLHEERCQVVLSHTRLSPRRESFDDTGPEKPTDGQISGLTDWIRSGDALLATHATTVIGKSDQPLGGFLAGVFVSHPLAFTFTVHPVHEQHPITTGFEALQVHDEFYAQTHAPGTSTIQQYAKDLSNRGKI